MNGSESDVVIVGGGMAGLVAAARASELGLAATVLERGTTPDYPCNARWSGGVLHIAYTDITSDPDTLRKVIDRDTASRADPNQADMLIAHGARFLEWLRAQGSTFVSTKIDWQQFILEPMREMRAGLDWQNRGPDQLMGRLTGVIERNGGKVVLGARARSLSMEGGSCCGVEAEINGQARSFPADAVILADGGFQGNPDLVGRHISSKPEAIKQRGAGNGTGDGFAMAEAAGAAVAGLDRFYGHLLSRDSFANDSVWPYPELDALACAGILVNGDGRRFTDEGLGGIAVTNALAKSDDPVGAAIIFDSVIWEGPGRSARIPANPTLEGAGGTVLRADSIEELADLAGLPPAAVAATVAAYNSAIDAGAFAVLNPPRSPHRYAPMPIAARPFHAIPVCAGITYTMGGILIDGQSQVLKGDGKPIAGLYAAGSNTGGLEGDGDGIISYVGGLAKAGIQGMIAAEAIARAHGLSV